MDTISSGSPPDGNHENLNMDEVLLTLDPQQDSFDPENAVEAANFLETSAEAIAQDSELAPKVMNDLIELTMNDAVDPQVKRSAWKAGKAIWLAEWGRHQKPGLGGLWARITRFLTPRGRSIGQDFPHQAIFSRFLKTLGEDDDQIEGDWEIKREAADELGRKAGDIAKNDDMIQQAMLVLIQRINSDDLEVVRRSACVAMSKIWDAGWGTEENQESKRQTILDLVLGTLDRQQKGSNTWFVRQASADWLKGKAADIAQDERMLDKTLDALIGQANDKEEKTDARRSAREAAKTIWEAGWQIKDDRDTRRPDVLHKVFDALGEEEDDPQDWQFRQSAANWLGEKAADLVQNESMTREALDVLVDRAVWDSDEYIRRTAEEGIRAIWNAGWEAGQGDEDLRERFLDLVLAVLKMEEDEEWPVRMLAANWLQTRAREIAQDERLMVDALNVLLSQSNKEKHFPARRRMKAAIEKLWEEGWEAFDIKRGWRNRNRGAGETRETQRWAVFNQVLRAMKGQDWELRAVAMGWVDENAAGISPNEQLFTNGIKALFRALNPDKEERIEVRRAAREAISRLMNSGWQYRSQQQVIMDQVLKLLEEDYPGDEVLEFKLQAVQWLGDKSRTTDIVSDYDMAEKVAATLVRLRQDVDLPEAFQESAGRSLLRLWEELRSRKEYQQKQLRAELDSRDEELKDRTVRRLANENTLGARDNVGLLIDYWTAWIAENKEPRLVELTAEKLRENDHAVLPFVEHFTSGFNKFESDPQKAAGQLKVRRRIARQLADMSDPKYYDDPASRESILRELKEYAVPVFVQHLPEEKDVEILENMARLLAYSRRRSAVNALATEVVGESRERKGRQELLATYYLEPSKKQSEQAAGILQSAVGQARKTLTLLRVLNSLVVFVGLGVIALGLFSALFGGERFAGLLAAFGGGAAVVYQLVRRPMDRIQEANSNLVQMETAFTSFIWELNLNGTFIQSAYVKNGQLKDEEIDSTLDRIEAAMKLTMNFVSGYTKAGNQRLVTRINKIEPVAGTPGTELTIYGQHLLGDLTARMEGGGRPVVAKVRDLAGTLLENGELRTDTAVELATEGTIPIEQEGLDPPGMVAIDHRTINSAGNLVAWENEAIKFVLPPSDEEKTVWISLFVDGMETNALPFQIIQQVVAEGEPEDDQ